MSEHEKLGVQPQNTSFSTSSNLQTQQGPLMQDNHPAEIIQRASIYPGSLTSSDIMQLQNSIGNRAVCQLMQDLSLMQPQAAVKQEAKPGDFRPPAVQSIKAPGAEPVQMQAENNTGLPDALKAGVEQLSGIDMSEVRVHYNSDKPAQLGALAYTQGTDIHVAAGQEKHLPHEAWHVVQQAQRRVQPTVQLKGAAVNDELGLESEADEKGRQSLKAGKKEESLDFDSIAKDIYKAASGADIIQKMNNGEEEEEEESSGGEEELSGGETKRQEAEKEKAIRKYKFEKRHLLQKDSSGHGKGKKISPGSKRDKHQIGQKRKTDRKKTLKGRVEEATEKLEDLGIDPNKIKSASKLKKEKKQAMKQEKKKKKKEDK